MVLAMETMIRHQSTDLNEFLIPKILKSNLKKKIEDRSMSYEPSGFVTDKNGENINIPLENVKKNLSKKIVDDEPSSVDIDIETSVEDEESVTEMAQERHRYKGGDRQSSYLLQPFLKPVAQHVEGNASENPILRALFGGSVASNKNLYNWVNGDKTTTTNCHPFKKTDLSRDIVNDSMPAQVPKSLSRDRQRSASPVTPSSRSKPRTESCPLKENTSKASFMNNLQPVTKARPTMEKENKHPLTPDEVLRRTFSKVNTSRVRVSSVSSLKKIGYINSDKLMKLRALVDNAIKNHKVYSMTGCYNSVRNALRQRGWIEKIDTDIKGKKRQNKFEEIGIYDAAFQFVQKYPTLAAMRYSIQTQSGFSHNDQINYSGQGEAEIINRMLRNINEDLCWLSRPYPYYCWKDVGKFELINRLPKAYFSNKIGLCNSLQHIQWYFEPGVCSTQYPRTYNVSQKDEYDAFKDDFRLTACINLLKWLTMSYRSGGEKAVRSTDGKVDACIVDFALKRCTEYVKYREHEDIDLPDLATVWEYQWDHFIAQYYRIINEGQLLKDCKNDPSIQVYVTSALAVLNLVKAYWPQINIDGYQNFWVVKPGGRCCGSGIVIKNNLEQILMLVNPTVSRETRYVVQKYIERPLLIYNTKFDIRQWFLVTCVYPLTVWMYRESYLRFCSQPFTLKNTHESIHLCNNAVQKRYKNSKRDRGLPDENMWDCYTFQTYLKSIGHPDAWEKYIYPGMKEGFIGALLASQDTMERRNNCFELYGADFMISDTLTDGPWLIEINSNPAMDPSSSVTARMCPQVLEDMVKVVIDRRDDKNASTGAFELVYKQHCPPVPPYLGMSLSIKGQKVHRMSPGDPKPYNKKSKSPNSCGKFLQSETEDSQSEDPNDSGRKSKSKKKSTSKIEVERKISPVLTSEVLEGLKKEIFKAKLSIHMLNRERDNGENGLLRKSSEIIKGESITKKESKIFPRKSVSQGFENKQTKSRNDEDKRDRNEAEEIEITTHKGSVVEIASPKTLEEIRIEKEERPANLTNVTRELSNTSVLPIIPDLSPVLKNDLEIAEYPPKTNSSMEISQQLPKTNSNTCTVEQSSSASRLIEIAEQLCNLPTIFEQSSKTKNSLDNEQSFKRNSITAISQHSLKTNSSTTVADQSSDMNKFIEFAEHLCDRRSFPSITEEPPKTNILMAMYEQSLTANSNISLAEPSTGASNYITIDEELYSSNSLPTITEQSSTMKSIVDITEESLKTRNLMTIVEALETESLTTLDDDTGRILPKIAENTGRDAPSEHSLYFISQQDLQDTQDWQDGIFDVTERSTSSSLEIETIRNYKVNIIGEIHQMEYVKLYEGKEETMAEVIKSDDEAKEKCDVSDFEKYIHKQGVSNEVDRLACVSNSEKKKEISVKENVQNNGKRMCNMNKNQQLQKESKKAPMIKKTTWKTNVDYKRRWKVNKRKKVDYVRKNIEDLRQMQERPRVTYRSSKIKNMPYFHLKVQEQRHKVSTFSDTRRRLDDTKLVPLDTEDYEKIYWDEILKMFRTMDFKKFMKHLCSKQANYLNKCSKVSPLVANTFSWDGQTWREEIDVLRDNERIEIPSVCNEVASELGVSINKTTEPSMKRQSCPNISLDKEYDHFENQNKIKSDLNLRESGIDWKANIESARRACQEVLKTLREFNETNSKVRSQQALRKGKELELTGALKAFRKLKYSGKHLSRVQAGNERGKKREDTNTNGSSSSRSGTNLAINSENGAVRKVDPTLPKI